MEGDVCWNPKNNTDFDYEARGKLRVERQECKVSEAKSAFLITACLISSVSDEFVVSRSFFSFQLSVQLNRTSDRVRLHSFLSHPFKSKIPKTLEVGCYCVSSSYFIQLSEKQVLCRDLFLGFEVSYYFIFFIFPC